MMSLDDWNAWQETFALLSNPHMAQKLEQGIAEFNNNLNTVSYTHLDVYKRQALTGSRIGGVIPLGGDGP